MNMVDRQSGETQRVVAPGDEPGFPASVEAFQVEHLLDRCLCDREFCAVLLRKFTARAPVLSHALSEAVDADHDAELARHAHLIKGSAANLSADNLFSCASALECAVQDGNSERIRPLVARVRDEIERCVEAVPRVLEQLAESS